MEKVSYVARDLEKAKALIDTPHKWTQGTYAQDSEGWSVTVSSADAVCYCAHGAIAAVGGLGSERTDAMADAVAEVLELPGKHEYNRLPPWNDAPERTHAEVMEAFDKAIAYAQEKGL